MLTPKDSHVKQNFDQRNIKKKKKKKKATLQNWVCVLLIFVCFVFFLISTNEVAANLLNVKNSSIVFNFIVKLDRL